MCRIVTVVVSQMLPLDRPSFHIPAPCRVTSMFRDVARNAAARQPVR
jgi:hypothetical protein